MIRHGLVIEAFEVFGDGMSTFMTISRFCVHSLRAIIPRILYISLFLVIQRRLVVAVFIVADYIKHRSAARNSFFFFLVARLRQSTSTFPSAIYQV